MKSLPAAKIILITGASRGIGAVIARTLAAPGRILLLTARKREHLYNTARACSERGAEVKTYAVELADAADIAHFVAEVKEEFAELDMLVNNAGILGPVALPWESDTETWWQTQLINVRAPFLLQQAFVPGMLEKGGGRIVDLSSGAAIKDTPDHSAYYVSKTALFRLAGSLHLAGAEKGLRVFAVAPGVVKTDMTQAMQMHIGRTEWNAPEEVAAIIAAIATGELDGISGTQVRAGTDDLDELRRRSVRGVKKEEKKLRLTPWDAQVD